MYEDVVEQKQKKNITGALLRKAAPITVTCFTKDLDIYAEELRFTRRGAKDVGSSVYLLRPQYKDLYSEQRGLCLPTEKRFNCIF